MMKRIYRRLNEEGKEIMLLHRAVYFREDGRWRK
jgi:hypothetical protein